MSPTVERDHDFPVSDTREIYGRNENKGSLSKSSVVMSTVEQTTSLWESWPNGPTFVTGTGCRSSVNQEVTLTLTSVTTTTSGPGLLTDVSLSFSSSRGPKFQSGVPKERVLEERPGSPTSADVYTPSSPVLLCVSKDRPRSLFRQWSVGARGLLRSSMHFSSGPYVTRRKSTGEQSPSGEAPMLPLEVLLVQS